ncbi:hypothetical protein EPN42_10080 [bacterium]|nr:MAG: hypothetical protein EPN42_10080 [bacterium]
MPSEARLAEEGDVARIARLLHDACGERSLAAYERAVRARIAEEDGGALIAGDTTLSWALDGGALFLYDLVGEGETLAAAVTLAECMASRRLAAVLAATLYEDDPMAGQLRVLGFEPDWSELEAAGGRIRSLVGLVRTVGELEG